MKYWQFIWQTDMYLSVAVAGNKYCIFGRVQGGHRRLIIICGKFAAVSCGIWQTGPRNLEKFAAENCGPYLLLLLAIMCFITITIDNLVLRIFYTLCKHHTSIYTCDIYNKNMLRKIDLQTCRGDTR